MWSLFSIRTPDSARFEAIPDRSSIRKSSLRGCVRQENCPTTWNTRWLYMPHWTPATPRSDLLFVRCAGEDQYHACILIVFGRFCTAAEPEPDVNLVAFPRPFHKWYSTADQVR